MDHEEERPHQEKEKVFNYKNVAQRISPRGAIDNK